MTLNKTNIDSSLIEEYKTLRDEIMLHMKLERQILALAGTIFFIVLTFLSKLGDHLDYNIWGIILVIILTPIFLIYRGELFSIAKIASYIDVCIEPNIQGLKWTGRHIQSLPKFSKGIFTWKIFKISIHTAIGSYFLILLVLAWILPIYMKRSLPSIATILIMLPFTVVYVLNFFSLLSYRKHRKKWEHIWIKTIESENSNK